MRIWFRAIVLLVSVGLPLTLTAPARADSIVESDAAEAKSPSDLRWVRVTHGAKNVVLKIKVTDLAPVKYRSSSVAIYVDTRRRSGHGPEYVLGAPLHIDSDWNITRAYDWTQTGGPLNCSTDVDLDGAADIAWVRISRGCLGSPGSVRVAVQMTDHVKTPAIHDWLGGWRHLTRWVAV